MNEWDNNYVTLFLAVFCIIPLCMFSLWRKIWRNRIHFLLQEEFTMVTVTEEKEAKKSDDEAEQQQQKQFKWTKWKIFWVSQVCKNDLSAYTPYPIPRIFYCKKSKWRCCVWITHCRQRQITDSKTRRKVIWIKSIIDCENRFILSEAKPHQSLFIKIIRFTCQN